MVLLLKAGGHLAHLHGAALAAGARQDVVVEEIEQLDLAARLLNGAQRLLGESLAVAALSTCANGHNLELCHEEPLSWDVGCLARGTGLAGLAHASLMVGGGVLAVFVCRDETASGVWMRVVQTHGGVRRAPAAAAP